MINVVIIGAGNVAQQLIIAFKNSANLNVVQAYARNKQALIHLLNEAEITDDINLLKDADLYIIAVNDNAIQQLVNQLPFSNKLVVHTSGTIPIFTNNNNKNGVFYPLQTISKNKKLDFTTVPICLEAEFEEDYALLEAVANGISNSVYKVNSSQRKSLHVAAVFVCNFVNHMYVLGNEICQENNLDFSILKPLIQETAHKIEQLQPIDAQTGPAKRNDTVTINEHLIFLTNENNKQLYKLLTKSIIDYGKKL